MTVRTAIGPRFLQKASASRYRRTGLQLTHRLRAELALGKPLPPFAVVHHADGSRDPLAPLVICQDAAYHKLLHLRMKIKAAGGNPNTDKVCSVCKQAKSLEDFGIDRNGPLGRQGSCKPCAAARMKAKYDANPEHYRQKTRNWRAAH